MTDTPPPSTSMRPGDTLDQFQIVEQIGAGGNAIVWKARDPLLDRFVAIKQLNLNDASDTLRQRFHHEADLMRQLGESHPRLVRFITLIDEPRGLFIVMEYVHGPSLEQRLSQSGQPLAPLTALRIIRTLGIVLDAIHRQKVIHRDLKPSNILLPKAGLKLCDLGIATAMADQQAMTLGSVRYMAPELLRNKPGDGRSDLYSLGMVAYEMLAGRAVFAQVFKNVLRDPRNQAMRWMKWHTHPRLTAPPLSSLNPQVPPRLSELVARLMEKDPAKRIASARQLVETIDHHFTDPSPETPSETPRQTPEKVSPETPSERPTDAPDTAVLPRRKRWPIGVAVVLTLLMLSGGGWWANHTRQQRVRRQMQKTLAQEKLDAAQTAYQQGHFEQAATLYTSAASFTDASDILRQAKLGKQWVSAQMDMEAERFDAARKTLERLDAASQVPRDTIRELMDELQHRETFAMAMTQAQADLDRNDIGQARHHLQRWRDAVLSPQEQTRWDNLQVQLQGHLTQREIEAALKRAQAMYDDGQIDQAIEWLTQANQQLFNSPQVQAVIDAWISLRTYHQQVQRGQTALAQGDWEGAILAYQAALRVHDDAALSQHILQLQSDAALAKGQQQFQAGDQAGALASFTHALGYADTPEARGWLARMQTSQQRQALIAAGDRAMALKDFPAAQNQYRAAAQLDPAPEVQLTQKINRARVQQLMKQATASLDAHHYPEARRQLEQARAIAPNTPGVGQGLAFIDKRLRYQARVEAGDQLRQQSKFVEAKTQYRQAQKIIADDAIAQRLDGIEYEHLIAQGRAYLATRQWLSAKAVLTSAIDLQNTPTAQRLLAQANAEHHDEP